MASSRRYSAGLVAALLVTAAATLLGVLAAVALFSADSTVKLGVEAGQLAVLAVLLLAIPAWMVLRARDSRRFAIGIVGAAVLWFILWYPNLTGLPLPDSLANVYLGLLPTWNYDFQFTVNMDPPAKGSILRPERTGHRVGHHRLGRRRDARGPPLVDRSRSLIVPAPCGCLAGHQPQRGHVRRPHHREVASVQVTRWFAPASARP